MEKKTTTKKVEEEKVDSVPTEKITLEERKALNIYEKMALATARIERVKKSLTIEISKTNSYKAVSEGGVLEAVKPIEEELGIYSYPIERGIVDKDIVTTTSEYNGNVKESSKFFMRVETTYRFVNIDKPEEYLDIITYGDGIDSGDKAPGKAMTYADKYALLKAYKIETGEDPDANASEGLKGSNNKMAEARANNPISAKQLELITKWSNNGEHTDKILEELKTDTGKDIKAFKDLTAVDASNYITKKINEMNAKKAQAEAEEQEAKDITREVNE